MLKLHKTDFPYVRRRSVAINIPDKKFRNVSSQEIEKIIYSLNTKNPYGFDEIST
jgi:hypothetical protein